MLLTLAVDEGGIILRKILNEIYTVVTAAMHFDKWKVYIRIYLVTVLFACSTITGPNQWAR